MSEDCSRSKYSVNLYSFSEPNSDRANGFIVFTSQDERAKVKRYCIPFSKDSKSLNVFIENSFFFGDRNDISSNLQTTRDLENVLEDSIDREVRLGGNCSSVIKRFFNVPARKLRFAQIVEAKILAYEDKARRHIEEGLAKLQPITSRRAITRRKGQIPSEYIAVLEQEEPYDLSFWRSTTPRSTPIDLPSGYANAF